MNLVNQYRGHTKVAGNELRGTALENSYIIDSCNAVR